MFSNISCFLSSIFIPFQLIKKEPLIIDKKDRSSRVKICNFTDHVTQIFTINKWNLPIHLSDFSGVILFIHLAILRYVKEFKVSKKSLK